MLLFQVDQYEEEMCHWRLVVSLKLYFANQTFCCQSPSPGNDLCVTRSNLRCHGSILQAQRASVAVSIGRMRNVVFRKTTVSDWSRRFAKHARNKRSRVLLCNILCFKLETKNKKCSLFIIYYRPAQPFQCSGPLSHEEIHCGSQTFLWRNKSLDFDTFYAITRDDIESYSHTQCCQLVWM